MDLSGTVSEIHGDLSRKLEIFPPLVFYTPADGVPLGIGYRTRGQKLEWWGYQMVEKVLW